MTATPSLCWASAGPQAHLYGVYGLDQMTTFILVPVLNRLFGPLSQESKLIAIYNYLEEAMMFLEYLQSCKSCRKTLTCGRLIPRHLMPTNQTICRSRYFA